MIKIQITGLKELITRYKNAPQIVDKELERGFKQAMMTIERNVKKLTPVDTGRLRASIGGAEGWKWITARVASIGTRVKYAWAVEHIPSRHKVGQVHYFSEGVATSMEAIHNFFKQAMQRVAERISR